MATEQDQQRAQVVALLVAGEEPAKIAQKLSIKKDKVLRIREELPVNHTDVLPERRKSELSELIGDYLQESLTTLAVQVQHFRNPEWLFHQTAGELAVLHSTIHDKTIRILEAAERAASAGNPSISEGQAPN